MKVEVIERKETDGIDWDVCPQILQYNGDSDHFKVVYLGDGDDESEFKGIVLTNEGTGWSLFEISAEFSRELFKPFYGVITIKN